MKFVSALLAISLSYLAQATANVPLKETAIQKNSGNIKPSADDKEQSIALLSHPPRRAAVGDFARFNKLFDDASITIDEEFEVSQKIALIRLTLKLRNIRCYDITVGDITVDHVRNSNQDIDVLVEAVQLDLRCDIDYRYDYGLLRGGGVAKVDTDNNSLSTQLSFASDDFNTQPPKSSSVQACTTNIEITNIDFSGDFVSNIVEIFEKLIRDVIEREIEKVACDELGSLGTSFVSDMLDIASETLEQYQGDLGAAVTDPLFLEQNTNLPDNMVALNLQDTENTIGNWFNQALQEIDTLLGSVVPDPDGPNSNKRDLGVNVLLRSSLLDENRALVVDVAQLPIDPVLFDGGDKLTETTITLNQVKILGLDTMTRFNPLIGIGKHTLENELTWERLTVEFDVTVDILPSSKDGAILQGSTSQGISERINIDFGVENVDVVASLLLVIDQEALGSMEVGPLLQTDNLLPCLLSVVHDVQLSGLHVDPQSLNIPTLTGFVSPGIDRIVTDAVEAAFAMYTGVLEEAIPNIFQTSIKDFVNREVIEPYMSDPIRASCPSVKEIEGFIDFRDLLLIPQFALISGGSGTQPYGNLAYTVMEAFKNNLLTTDADGLLDLNSFLIRPLTESQSGTAGTFRLPSDIVSMVKTDFANEFIRSFVDRFEIGISDARLQNLDILKAPVSILKTTNSPNTLTNVLTMGPVADRPINITVGFLLSLEGQDSPLSMNNEVDISIAFDSASINGDLLAKIDASRFLHFPLKDVLIPVCWLATMPAPQLDADGFRVAGSDFNLALEQLAMRLSGLDMNVNIKSATSPGVSIISDLISTFKSSGGSSTLLNRVNDFGQELIESDWLQKQIDQGLFEAPKLCPHSPEYDENAVSKGFAPVPFPVLSAKTIDSMFYAASVVAEISFLVFVENHRMLPLEPTDPLSSQNTMNLMLDSILDWTNLGGRIGPFVDSALVEARRYLGGIVEDKENDTTDLGINIVIRDWLLEGNSDLNVVFDDLSFDLPGVEITLDSLNIQGLDSFTKFDIWEAIAPQTVQNTVELGNLSIELRLKVARKGSMETLQDLSISLSMSNVRATIPLFIALNQDKLEALEIGSFMQIKNILPCLLSAVDAFDITQIDLSIGNLEDPEIKGLLPNTDASIMAFTDAVMSTYKSQIYEAIPNIFDNTLRGLLNGLLETYLEDTPCLKSEPPSDSPFVDFRQFFESNENTYGDLPPLLKGLIDSELLAVDQNTGRPRINEILIASLTEQQSGQEGTLEFPGDVFAINSESIPQFGLNSIELRAFDPSIKNLDTFVAPMAFLKPNVTNGFVIDNIATLATGPESLHFALTGLFELQGDPMLEMRNELELSVDMAGSQLIASLMAKLDSEALFSFPLRDVVNLDCWLAALAAPLLVENGYIIDGSDTGLSLESILLSIPSMSFSVSCTNCTSQGLSVLPELLGVFEEEGVTGVLQDRLVDLGLDLLHSDFIQAYINRLLVDGSMRCPHSSTFVDALASSEYPVPSFPSLSYKSLESVAFASTVLMHSAIVVIAGTHASYAVDAADPLTGQTELDAESGDTRLIDFSALEDSVGEWADIAIEQLLDYVSAVINDPKGPNGKDLRVNNLLRSTLLDDNGVLDIEFNDLSFGGEAMEVSLKHVRVTGLDSISSFDVLQAIGPQTLRNKLKWESLGIQVVVSLMGSDEMDPSGRALKTKEDITLSLKLGDIDVSLALLLAMDLDLLGSLQLGSMLEIENILPCMLSAARAAKLTELDVSVGSIKEFSVEGFQSNEISDAATDSSRVILEKYGETILSSMPGFFDLTVRSLLNNWMSHYMDDTSNVGCPSASLESTSASRFVDFRDLLLTAAKAKLFGGTGSSPYGDLFRTALGIVQDLVFKVDTSTGLSKVNDVLVGPLTRSQSKSTGSIVFPGDLFSGGTRLQVGGLDATVQLRASNARVDNLDTVGSPLALLEAVRDDAYELNSTATFGVADRPLQFSVRFLISLLGDGDMNLRNELDISLDLLTANVILKAMMKVAESRFYGFPLRDALDYNCWMAMIPAPSMDSRGLREEGTEPTAALAELAASVAQMNLNISCVECSSPRMSELTELLSSREAQEDATEVANMLLDYVTQLMGGNFLQVQIDRLLNDAAMKCPHSPMYQPDAKAAVYEPIAAANNDYATTYLVLLGCVALVLILVVGLVMLTVRCVVRRRHRRFLELLPPNQVRRLERQQHKEQELESELNASTLSMSSSPEIPRLLRWSMPFILLGNIGFFISGHLSLGATVNIEAVLAGEKFRVDNFFEFSMARSTVDIWNAGGRELAILILIFSVIWPYTKQVMTLILWFLPPSRVSISRRGSILVWLDWLAKWSMIDIFVLVISIAAFRVSIASPNAGFLPDNFYSIDLLVVPLWGLYANMIAQLISQVSSHFIIHYHRQIVAMATVTQKERHQLASSFQECVGGEQKSSEAGLVRAIDIHKDTELSEGGESLRSHRFTRPHRGEIDKLVVRNWIDRLLWFVAFSLVILVTIGCILPSFSLEIFGLIGVAVESGQGFEDATTYHSVLTVVKLLMEEAQFLGTAGDYIGLGTLSILLLSSVLLVPMVQCIALMYQWFSPSTRSQRARIFISIEILQAWQYAEVYLIAIFVASWQLGPVSEFMINSYCDSLKDTFAQWVYYGILKEEDAQCFSVKSSIEGGSFILAAGAILLALLNTFVNKAVIQYFRDEDERDKRFVDDEESSKQSEWTSNTDKYADDADVNTRIHPVPVLFTDTFRWLLRRDESANPSSGAVAPELNCQETAQFSIEADTSDVKYSPDEIVSNWGEDTTEESEQEISLHDAPASAIDCEGGYGHECMDDAAFEDSTVNSRDRDEDQRENFEE